VRKPILVLLPVSFSGADPYRRFGLTPTVSGEEDAALVPLRAGCLPAHVKFDTGMGRLGFHWTRARATAAFLRRRGIRRIEGVYTHLSSPAERGFTRVQLERFRACRRELSLAGVSADSVHVGGSPAVAMHPSVFRGITPRPGLMLYGYGPAGSRVPFALSPALEFKTRVAAVREVPAGSTVSYGHTWTAPRRTRLALLPAGYSAGLSRRLSGKGHALIRGRRVPFRGIVCMNLTVVDVTGLDMACRVGDQAVLIGGQGRARIGADEMADLGGTIPYEVLCMVGGLNPRVYVRTGRGA
jgi:alanine racemase